MLAVAPLNSQLIAAALDIEIGSAQAALAGLEACSLLDDTEDGDFRIHEAVHHYIQNNLFSISELKTPRKRLTHYLLNWVDTAEETTPTYKANLAHLYALLGHSVQAEDWSLIADFSQVTKRPTLISGGNIRVLYKTQYFLAQFDGIDFSNAVVTKSDLSASLFNGCEFSHSTLGGVHLPGAVFRGCEFTNTHLLDVDLRGAQFVGCNFADYIFADVALDGTVFRGCTGIEALNLPVELKTE